MGWGFCTHNSTHNMRDKHYKIKHIRMDEKTWQTLKEKRKRSGLSWNKYLLELINKK